MGAWRRTFKGFSGLLKRAYIFAICSVGLAAGPLLAAIELDKATVKGNISIQLPKNWKVTDNPGTLVTATAPQAEKDNTGAFLTSLIIAQKAGPVNMAAAQQAVMKEYPNYRVVEQPAQRVINGVQATIFGGTFTPQKSTLQLRVRFYLFSVNNQVYTVTFISLASKWAVYDATVEASVATFAIKPPASAPHAVH